MIHGTVFNELTLPYLEIPDLSKMRALADGDTVTGFRWRNPTEANAARWAMFMMLEAGLGKFTQFRFDMYTIHNNSGNMEIIMDNVDYGEGPSRRMDIDYCAWQYKIQTYVNNTGYREYNLPMALTTTKAETWFNKEVIPPMLENRNTEQPKFVVEVDQYSPLFKLFLMCSRGYTWNDATSLLNGDRGAIQKPGAYIPPVDQFCLTYSAMKRTWCKGKKTSYYGKEFRIVKLSELVAITDLAKSDVIINFPNVTNQNLAQLIKSCNVRENQRYVGEIGLRPDQKEELNFTLKDISDNDAAVCIEDSDESIARYSELANFKILKEIHAGYRYPVNQNQMDV